LDLYLRKLLVGKESLPNRYSAL